LERVYQALKNTQTQLLQQSTMASIGQLAAGVAHEINTPIQYIGDNSRFLIDSFNEFIKIIKENKNISTGNVDVQYLCREIPAAIQQTLEGVEHVAEIVKAMKEFSHPGTVEKTPTDLNRAIMYTITVAKNEWKYIADLKTNLCHNLPMVWCQPNEMNQVFLNLISNACHAIEEKNGKESDVKGLIEITTKQDGEYAVIVIRDTGIGIADSIKSRVYEPFFTTKEVGEGTGQGLSIVHNIIVQKHQGTIGFESIEGEGTTFTLRVPIKSA
jgi:signal transduction histidine kinase